jgi:hypothetical protein
MAWPITFRVNTDEFTATLNRYRQLASRDPKKICDTKAFFIARRAVIETPKADKAQIKDDLGRIIHRKKQPVRMSLRTVKRYTRYGLEVQVPLAALIINARRGRGRGLYGSAMTEAIRAMLAARLRSIAFLKSGWLPAIRTLVGLADTRGAPRQERGPAQIGVAKGYAVPAQSGWRARTIIANMASTRKEDRTALYKYAEPALQRAFDAEEASMRDYIERKMRETAQAAGVRTG